MTEDPDIDQDPDPGALPNSGVRGVGPEVQTAEHLWDLLIVGSGVAGLAAALEASRRMPALSILLVTRGALGGHGASSLAQGGVAAAVDPTDSPELHARDTREAGAGLARPDLVDVLTRDGPDRVRELIDIGARFDRAASGSLALGLEGAHSRHRILHARGDQTGWEVTRALREAVRDAGGIEILEHTEVLELLEDRSGVHGVLARGPDDFLRPIHSRTTLLATGGAGRVYLRTTSPPGLAGDGLAMAARAGANLRDLEFMQFHPTALAVDTDPLPLVTEALRGAGARLVDRDGHPVLDPEDGDELSSRDRVARQLWRSVCKGVAVFLDARGPLGEEMAQRFPGVHELCRLHGIDPAVDLIPVTPAAHYHMGGIAVDREGRSSRPGLWAAGEVAASGVHGANRLASNSLLEGLVFGPRAARSMIEAAATPGVGTRATPATLASLPSEPLPDSPSLPHPELRRLAEERLAPDTVLRIRTLMWEKVGVERDETGMREAIAELDQIDWDFRSQVPTHALNLLLVARLIVHAALLRAESRGSHFRLDFPHAAQDPARHSLVRLAVGTGDILGELESPVPADFPEQARPRGAQP